MARKKNYKITDHSGTIDGVIEDARSDLEELASEIRDWADNMESGGLGHTEKYEQVAECADALECVDLDLNVPECLEGFEVKYQNKRPYGRKAMSRAMRCENLQSMLDAVTARAEEFADDDEDESDEAEEQRQEVREFAESISEAVANLEMIDFPGMY